MQTTARVAGGRTAAAHEHRKEASCLSGVIPKGKPPAGTGESLCFVRAGWCSGHLLEGSSHHGRSLCPEVQLEEAGAPQLLNAFAVQGSSGISYFYGLNSSHVPGLGKHPLLSCSAGSRGSRHCPRSLHALGRESPVQWAGGRDKK